MTIKVTYAFVENAANDIRNVAKELDTQLTDLERRVNAVVQTWEGETKQVYENKQQHWNRNVKGLNDTLEAIARALDGATDGYRGTDKKAAAQFDF
ncbi:hypothetical protein GCM10010420_24020 [Streptomyces glaucosporus]|uniref:ESAT-6-like protein n=1 Tax=Streptomyces glaucosporus TaxID=284044 RepID=A0ABN3I828_9ACTN